MALQKQNIPIALGVGVDTKTDPKIVQPGKMLLLENAVFQKPGQQSKRFGYSKLGQTILGTSSTITTGTRLGVFKDELLAMSSDHLYSYVSSSDSWLDAGNLSSVSVQSKQIVRNTRSQSMPDCATLLGVTVYAWQDSNGSIKASVIDESTGLALQSDVTIVGTGSRPKVNAGVSRIFIYYYDNVGAIKVVYLVPTSPLTFSSAVTWVSDINTTNPNYDIQFNGSHSLFIYNTSAASVIFGYLKATDGTSAGPVEGLPSPVTIATAGTSCVAITSLRENGLNDSVYAFYSNTTNGLVCRVALSDLTTTATVTVDAIVTLLNNIGAVVVDGTCHVWYEVNAAATYNVRIKYNTVLLAGTVGTAAEHIRSIGLVSKPFIGPDSNLFFVAAHESTFQSSYFTMRFISSTRSFVVNSISKTNGAGLTDYRTGLSNIASLSSNSKLFPATVKNSLVSETGSVYYTTGIQGSELTFNSTALYQNKEIGGNTHISGGILMAYDGKSVFEHGYNLFPENISNAITGAAGSIEAGTRQYKVVYEWIDNQGQVHESSSSNSLSVTNALNDKNTLTIPTLRITEKKTEAGRTPIVLAVYRTKIDGSVFYRVSTIGTTTGVNSVTADSVAIEDTLADTAIGANQILYTTGDVLDNDQASTSIIVDEYRNRLVLSGLEDVNLISYSKEKEDGTAVEFSDALNFRTDQGSGPVRATRSLDERMVIFKDTTIFSQVGNGATKTGLNDDFSAPQLVNADVGCPYPQSIVVMPSGLMFKSLKGFYRLTRSLDAEYIGAPVEAYNSLTVTGAVLVDKYNQIRFTHSDGACLVYDYLVNEWSVFTNQLAVSNALWQGNYVYLKSDGAVYSESTTSFLDNGSTVSMRSITPWISLAQLMGSQRLYSIELLGELRSAHILRIRISYDFDPSIREQFLFNSSTILGDSYYGEDAYYGASAFYGAVDSQYQIKIKPKIQKCTSFRLEIDDLNPTGADGGGFVITSMSAYVGMKQGQFKVPLAKRIQGT